jgi:hypothetical protein
LYRNLLPHINLQIWEQVINLPYITLILRLSY